MAAIQVAILEQLWNTRIGGKRGNITAAGFGSATDQRAGAVTTSRYLAGRKAVRF